MFLQEVEPLNFFLRIFRTFFKTPLPDLSEINCCLGKLPLFNSNNLAFAYALSFFFFEATEYSIFLVQNQNRLYFPHDPLCVLPFLN